MTPVPGTCTNTGYQSHRQGKVKWKIKGNVRDDRLASYTPVGCCGLLSRTKSVAVTWDVNSFYITGVWGQYLRLSIKKDFCRHGVGTGGLGFLITFLLFGFPNWGGEHSTALVSTLSWIDGNNCLKAKDLIMLQVLKNATGSLIQGLKYMFIQHTVRTQSYKRAKLCI